MKLPYWNNIERRKIDEISTANPKEALKKYELYMDRYPYDYEAQIMYASTLITLKEFDLAYEILQDVKMRYKSNIKIKDDCKVRKTLDRCALITEMRYLSYTYQFDKLYDLFSKMSPEDLKKYDHPRFYCNVNLGLVSEEDGKKLQSYLKRQIYSYSEDLFLEDLKKHLFETDSDEKDSKTFREGFPIEKVLEEVKLNLNKDNCICTGFDADTYIFKFDYCGKDDYKIQDYFKVICIHDTSNIIMMYPCKNCDKLDYVDLNYLNEYDTNPKETQKEKFYKKYSNNY